MISTSLTLTRVSVYSTVSFEFKRKYLLFIISLPFSFFIYSFLPSQAITSQRDFHFPIFLIFSKIHFLPHSSISKYLHLTLHLTLHLAGHDWSSDTSCFPFYTKPPLFHLNYNSFTNSKTYINHSFTFLFLFLHFIKEKALTKIPPSSQTQPPTSRASSRASSRSSSSTTNSQSNTKIIFSISSNNYFWIEAIISTSGSFRVLQASIHRS